MEPEGPVLDERGTHVPQGGVRQPGLYEPGPWAFSMGAAGSTEFRPK